MRKYQKPPKRRKEGPSLLMQFLIVFCVIVLSLLFVIAIDKYTHPGRDWSDTLLLRMMVERRLSKPYFK